jgi:hypothetical protein
VYFARALPTLEDCSQLQTPSWATLEPELDAGDAANNGKPLWLTLLHADGETRSCASLETFEALDDKFALAHALVDAGVAELAPPQLAIEYDTSYEDIEAMIAAAPPPSLSAAADAAADQGPAWVLKWAQGFGGQDIHFVRTAAEAAAIVSEAYETLQELPPCSSDDDAEGGEGQTDVSQPGWVLQSMVPSLLLRGRKMHIRTYVVALRPAFSTGGGLFGLRLYAYGDHEVRVAGSEMNEDLNDRDAHLTTGQWRRGGTVDDRTTLQHEPTLLPLGPAVMASVEALCAALPFTAEERTHSTASGAAFGITGLDFMVTPDGRVFLLEFNASPAAPPPATIGGHHADHLVEFGAALVELVSSPEPDSVAGFTRVGSRGAESSSEEAEVEVPL